MALEVNGKNIETTETGFLIYQEEWNGRVAEVIAGQQDIKLTQWHWDVIRYLRAQYIYHDRALPDNRDIVKGMQKVWANQKVDMQMLYELFPGDPCKHASRIAGLPERMQKGVTGSFLLPPFLQRLGRMLRVAPAFSSPGSNRWYNLFGINTGAVEIGMTTEKQKLIKKMLELQRKFSEYEHEHGLDLADYYDAAEGHPLANYRKEYDELAMKLGDLAHEEKGSHR
jgi:tRNA 2-thiouridine synthesizing protein E